MKTLSFLKKYPRFFTNNNNILLQQINNIRNKQSSLFALSSKNLFESVSKSNYSH